MGVIVQGTVRGGPSEKRRNWGRELNRALVPQEQQLQNACFVKKALFWLV